MDLLFAVTVAGVVTGAYYALLGLAIALVFRTTGVANFAQGELGTVSAFLLVMYGSTLPLPASLRFALAVAAGAATSAVVYLTLLRPRRTVEHLNLTVRTLAVYTLVHALTLYLWGANEPYQAPSLFPSTTWEIGGLHIAYDQIGTLAIAALLGLALFVLFRYTRVGLSMRAVAANSEVSSLLGIDVDRIGLVVWLLSGAIGALVALLVAPAAFLGTSLMQPYLLKAFTAAILGGLYSFPGVIAGGLLLGVIESMGAVWISIQLREPFTFAILLLVLLLRPAGLFGRVQGTRV